MKHALMGLMTLAVFASAPAFAQETLPPDSQLTQPGQQIAQPAAFPGTEGGAASGQMPAQPNAVRNTGAKGGDPCPAPANAAHNAPDDLAKVQEEIDRFTLCVQRAQLLERLNESALKNQNSGDMAMGFNPAMAGFGAMMGGGPLVPGMAGPQQGGAPMPPLPAGMLEGADVTPAANAGGAVPDSIAPVAAANDTAATEKPAEGGKWTIREIYGSGNNVQARLVSPDGDEVRARNGMKLPDGKTTVVRITPGGVTVRDAKGTESLEWARG